MRWMVLIRPFEIVLARVCWGSHGGDSLSYVLFADQDGPWPNINKGFERWIRQWTGDAWGMASWRQTMAAFFDYHIRRPRLLFQAGRSDSIDSRVYGNELNTFAGPHFSWKNIQRLRWCGTLCSVWNLSST